MREGEAGVLLDFVVDVFAGGKKLPSGWLEKPSQEWSK
jgi:hypothetical protein